MNVPIYLGRHQRADEPLGPRHGSAADPALPGGGLDQHRDHGHRLPGATRILASYDLSSLTRIGGGGAAMPEAVAQRLKDLTGLDYIEGYGLSETIAPDPHQPGPAPKKQCLGIPVCNTDAQSDQPGHARGARRPDEVGEIVSSGPQIFKGYWKSPEATRSLLHHAGGQAVLPHRRPRPLRRGRLLLHRRSPQAHDQRLGLQGLAGGGGVDALRASRHPGGVHHRHRGPAPRRDGEGGRRAQGRFAAARSRPKSSSAGAAATWRPTRSRAWSSSWTACPSPPPARSSGGCCRSRS